MKNIDLTKKVEHYKTYILLSYIKMCKKTLTFGILKLKKKQNTTIKVLFKKKKLKKILRKY